MDESKITIIDYVEKKLSAEIAEIKVLLAKTEFKAFALQEENQHLKNTIEELETKIKEKNMKEKKVKIRKNRQKQTKLLF